MTCHGEETGSSTEKLIAVDLDGTLVGPDNTVSPENVAAIQRARRAGIPVVVVTGRPYVSADALVTRIGLPPAPLVTFNGALVRRPSQGEILRSCPVPADPAREVVQECLERQLHLHYYLDDKMYVTRDNHWAQLYCRRTEMRCQEHSDLRQLGGREPFKLLVVDQPDTIKDLYHQFRRRWQDRLYVTRSMPEYLEFLSPKASKGLALDWLTEYYGVRRQNTLAIGDALNDLPLLERAGHAVAMPEGADDLKKIADFIPACQATGVADAIQWFLG